MGDYRYGGEARFFVAIICREGWRGGVLHGDRWDGNYGDDIGLLQWVRVVV